MSEPTSNSGPSPRRLDQLPSALGEWERIAERLREQTPAVFLDYDGTLTRIVDRPEDATLPPATRQVIEQLTERCPVAVISGRDLDDVRGMVDVEGIGYAGSHGFDVLGADGTRRAFGEEFRPDLEGAASELDRLLSPIDGARLERKRFALTVHFRAVAPERVPEVEEVVQEVAGRHPRLRVTGGKQIFELRPNLDWDKGKALLHVLDELGLERAGVIPIYLGDDVTDEDAFRVLVDRGIGVVVRGEDDTRPTLAHFVLDDPTQARQFLERLASSLEPR